MDVIDDKLSKLKESIFNTSLESRTEDNASVNKIMQLDNIDNDLKEALVLLTNNYTAELQAIRHHQVRSLISIIDLDIATLNKYKQIIISVDNLKKNVKPPVITFKNIIRTLSVVMTMTLFFTILYHYEPVAVDKSIEAIKSFIGIGIKIIKTVI